MDNFLLMEKRKEIEEHSADLGFIRTFFAQTDFEFIEAATKAQLLHNLKKTKGKKVVYRPATEDLLRFALERTPVEIVLGVEQIHPKDSLHYVRSGLDQVLCKIAAEKGKVIGFSFSDILKSRKRSGLLARMMFNIRLCKKYNVEMLFSTFASSLEELRSVKDLEALWRVLEKG